MASQSPGASAPILFNFKATEVRTIYKEGLIWFVASDIAKALNYSDATHMIRAIDDDEQGLHIVETLKGSQKLTVINESGLYHALFKSRKPEAQAFRKWVTAEVLPAIRKTGGYTLPPFIQPAQQNALQQLVSSKSGASGKIRAAIWSRFLVMIATGFSSIMRSRFVGPSTRSNAKPEIVLSFMMRSYTSTNGSSAN